MILITGATGLVGSHIAKLCVENQQRVRLLVRNTENPPQNLLSFWQNVEKYKGDILDTDSLMGAMQGVQKVIHCAALVTFGGKDADKLYKVNVEGTQNVVNACLQSKVEKLIYLSSVAAIGRPNSTHTINENTQWTDSSHNSQYAKSKYLAELEVWRGMAEGLKAEILCPSVVLGVAGGNRSSARIFYNIQKGMFAYPTGSVNIVPVEDVAKAAYLTLQSEHTGERYIINAAQISYKDFFTKIANGFGVKPPKWRLNKNLAMAGYYFLKIVAPWYLSARFINSETIRITSSHYFYDNKKFIEKYNFRYSNINEHIRSVCQQITQLTKK